MAIRNLLLAATCSAAVVVLAAAPADAKCTRLAFSVNDYGKDGPTKDARQLLDKYIADWTAKRGIKKYNTGKKDVTCELFLDFGVFDEHTCKAAATVCWNEGGGATTAAAPGGTVAPAKADAAASPASASEAPAKKAPAKAPSPVKKKDPA